MNKLDEIREALEDVKKCGQLSSICDGKIHYKGIDVKTHKTIEEALKAYEAMQWRSIESAPRDGTNIYGINKNASDIIHTAQIYHFRDNNWCIGTHSFWKEILLDEDGFCPEEYIGWNFPTHWTPLPPTDNISAEFMGEK